MLTRQVLVTSICATVVGIGFALPAFSDPAAGGATNPRSSPSVYNLSVQRDVDTQQQAVSSRLSFTESYTGPRRAVGYPCTWSGSRDLVQGEDAYRSGRYADAITRWKTAASKDCAIAAHKLGMLYYGGKSQVAADRSLGSAWLKVAADSKTANSRPDYRQMSRMAVRTLTKSQQAEYTADYARLRTSLGLPAEG